MESDNTNRRLAERFSITTAVILYKRHGEGIPANAVNISSSGMLVRLERSVPFEVDEEVAVETALTGHSDKPFSPWGIGRVVRVDTEHCAVQLRAGSFHVDK